MTTLAITPTIANRPHLVRVMEARLLREGHCLDHERRLLARRMAGLTSAKDNSHAR